MTQNAHHRIARNMGFVVIFLFLAKIAGAAKEIVVAHRFGVAEVVDAYLLVFTLLMWLPMVWTVVLATVYVPLSKQLEAHEAGLFTRELSGLTIVLGALLATFVTVLLPPFVPVLWNDFSATGQQQLQSMMRGLAPMVVGVFLASLYSAQLLSMEKHSNSLLDGVPSLVLAIVIFFVIAMDPINQFVFGSLLGVGLQVAGLAIILKHHDALTGVRFGFRSDGWYLFRNAIGIMIVSQLIMGLIAPIDLFMAGQIGQGNIAVYGYAQRILLLGMGLGATAVARAILPVLSDQDMAVSDSFSIVIRWTGLLWILGFAAALVGWFLSTFVVKLLFERGAFSAADTEVVSSALRYGLLQLPWYFSGVVLVQYFASQKRYRILFMSSVLALVVKLVCVGSMTRWMGVEGIMLSTSLMYFASWIFLIWSLRENRAFRGLSS